MPALSASRFVCRAIWATSPTISRSRPLSSMSDRNSWSVRRLAASAPSSVDTTSPSRSRPRANSFPVPPPTTAADDASASSRCSTMPANRVVNPLTSVSIWFRQKSIWVVQTGETVLANSTTLRRYASVASHRDRAAFPGPASRRRARRVASTTPPTAPTRSATRTASRTSNASAMFADHLGYGGQRHFPVDGPELDGFLRHAVHHAGGLVLGHGVRAGPVHLQQPAGAV